MALETLKDVTEIGGYEVAHEMEEEAAVIDTWAWVYPPFITVNDTLNVIAFKMQNGPIKEAGLNGCQLDTLIETAKIMIEGLNKNFPSYYNEEAISHLNMALDALARRKADREARGVEGLSKE